LNGSVLVVGGCLPEQFVSENNEIFASHRRFNRFHQRLTRFSLSNECSNTNLLRFLNEMSVCIGRQNDNRGLG
jgi:hypothetical protein